MARRAEQEILSARPVELSMYLKQEFRALLGREFDPRQGLHGVNLDGVDEHQLDEAVDDELEALAARAHEATLVKMIRVVATAPSLKAQEDACPQLRPALHDNCHIMNLKDCAAIACVFRDEPNDMDNSTSYPTVADVDRQAPAGGAATGVRTRKAYKTLASYSKSIMGVRFSASVGYDLCIDPAYMKFTVGWLTKTIRAQIDVPVPYLSVRLGFAKAEVRASGSIYASRSGVYLSLKVYLSWKVFWYSDTCCTLTILNTRLSSYNACRRRRSVCAGHSGCGSGEYCDFSGQCYPCSYCHVFNDAIDNTCPSKCTGGQCSSHGQCSSTEYCDVNRDCYSCSACALYDDAIDSTCPTKCSGSGSSASTSTTGATCTRHDQCGSGDYCDTRKTCFPCTGCAEYNDPVDGTCPSKCSSSGSSTVGVAGASCSAHKDCDDSLYCDEFKKCYPCSGCALYDDAFDGVCPAKCSSCRNNDATTYTIGGKSASCQELADVGGCVHIEHSAGITTQCPATCAGCRAAITHLYLVKGSLCPGGYQPIFHDGALNGDFNEGDAQAPFIQLCYKSQAGAKAITKIYATTSSSGACPTNYERVPQDARLTGDLNEGAGGEYVFLCFTRGSSKPITALTTMSQPACPANYQSILYSSRLTSGDLSEGARSVPQYMCSKHECTGTNGDVHDFCSPECPCTLNQGDCDTSSDCAAGLVCTNDVGAAFGMPAAHDVCRPPAADICRTTEITVAPAFLTSVYQANMNCGVTITAPQGAHVRLEFVDISIEYGTSCDDCSCDALIVTDPAAPDAVRERRLCGLASMLDPVYSYGNVLQVRFVTDGSVQNQPWNISIVFGDLPTWSTYGSSSYLLVEKTMSWDDAETHCASMGAHLASSQSHDENRFLSFLRREQTAPAWLGMRVDSNRRIRWTDAGPISLQYWKPGEFIQAETCVFLTPHSGASAVEDAQGSYWNSRTCGRSSAVRTFICEFSAKPLGRSYAVRQGARIWATLDDISPSNDTAGCQSVWIKLPAGWALATDDATTRSRVAEATWGTDCLILSSGSSYYTALGAASAGKDAGSRCEAATCASGLGCLVDQSVAGLRARSCQRRLLMEYQGCAASPCASSARCVDSPQGFTCQCPPGFTGQVCDVNINECQSNPCVRGMCVDQINGFACNCPAGYTGALCQTNIDECASSPCANGGTCVDQVNAFTCQCASGFAGDTCRTNINECASNPCNNGATCSDRVNGFVCTCRTGFTGPTCADDVNECSGVSTLCGSNGQCVNTFGSYSCRCNSGWQVSLFLPFYFLFINFISSANTVFFISFFWY